MLIDKFENGTTKGLLLDRELKAFYKISYTNELKVSSVFLAFNENSTLDDEFSISFSPTKNSEHKYLLQ